MPSYSPIDESSFNDNNFDAEAILGGRSNDFHHSPGREAYQRVSSPSGQDISFDSYSRTSAQPTPQQEDRTSRKPDRETPRRETEPQEYPAGDVKTKSSSTFARALKLISDSRTVLAIGLVFVVLAGYALIVSISYFSHIGTDQSAMLAGDFDPSMIKNTGGPFGAWISHTLLYNWLGLGAFFLIYYVAACGLSMLRVYRPRFWNLTLRCFLSAVATSIILGFATFELSSPILWGGRHGYLLTERLISLSGIWGALGLSIIMAGLVIILYISEIKHIVKLAKDGYEVYHQHQEQRKASRETRRQQEAARDAERKERIQAERLAKEAERREMQKTERRQEQEAEASQMEQQKAPLSVQLNDKEPFSHPSEKQAEPMPQPQTPIFMAPQTEDISEVTTDIGPIFADSPSVSPEPLNSKVDDVKEDEEDSLFPSDVDTMYQDEAEKPLFSSEPLFGTPSEESHGKKSAEEVLASQPFNPRDDLSNFKFPSLDLLRPPKDSGVSVDEIEIEANKQRIAETLRTFGVEISHIEATIGPTVTLFEIVPADGVRTRSVKSLGEDLQLSLAALGVRIIAPMPAKGTIGIEVPNKEPQVVSGREVLGSDAFSNSNMELPMALGKTISGDILVADLAKLPHLLVAGATGMGKSVGLNAIITSLLYKKHPSELKFVLIDPKRVELSLYRQLERHYLAALPDEDAIITDMTKVVTVLNSLCIEMDNRLTLLEQAGARNIKEYNEKFKARRLNPEKHRFLPYIVLVIDEFADLIIRQGKEIENPVSRLAAVARAAGIHLIIATQRPTVNVITGGIKLNIPGRIAFRVIQGNDSRTILDQLGANQLIGKGDMLFSVNGKLERVQCAFIDTPEVNEICEFIGKQTGFSGVYELPEFTPEGEGGVAGGSGVPFGDRDPLFEECARYVVQTDTASTSSLQRRYSIGYNRAGKIMDQMEMAGIVGPTQGGKPRQVLVDVVTLEQILQNN